MYFTSVIRYSPEHEKELPYYKIKESFRYSTGRVYTRLMLTSGYLPGLTGHDIPDIRRGLTYKMEQSSAIPGQLSIIFKALSHKITASLGSL